MHKAQMKVGKYLRSSFAGFFEPVNILLSNFPLTLQI